MAAAGSFGAAGRVSAFCKPYLNRPVSDGVLADVVSQLSLWGESETQRAETVLISTYHSAKGLEFERVICRGAFNGNFPFFRDTGEVEIAEARRLFYVGMTRAKRHLTITVPETYRCHPKVPSPFLRRIPPDCLTGDALKLVH